MSGGGKTQTATQQVSIPPEVMARYNAVNARAETAAAQPFQAYSYDPNAFVAPLTQTQQAAINNINQTAGMTQPFFQTAAGLTMGGAQGVGPLTQDQIAYYQNPFTQSVVGSTLANLQQQQGQQLSQQQAEAIKAGAFGGDRANIQRAQLQGQQGLAAAQAISPLLMQGYQQGVQTAMGQQGVLAQDLQRQLAAGQQLGGLGSAAQQAALAGAQAQLGAGTAEQQTQQAGLQALYNQFLQERGYPFQVAQFLANIAMGTGALSGSTTTTTQPAPFFSDEREKTNIQPLGDGLYAYDYKDDVRRAEEEGRPMPPKRVGPMAQDIEERAPGLVGDVNGHKVVGMNSMGGLVAGPGAYASGGQVVDPSDMQSILAAVGAPLQFYGGKGLYGGADKGGVGAAGYVPGGQMATPKLITAGGLPQQGPSTFESALDKGAKIAGLYKTGQEMFGGSGKPAAPAGPSRAAPPPPKGAEDKMASAMPQVEYPDRYLTYRGGLMRNHYAGGGALPYGTDDAGEDPLADVVKEGSAQKHQLITPGKLPSPTPGLGSELLNIGSLASSAKGLYGMMPAGLTEGIGAAASGLGSSLAGAGSAAASGLGSLAAGGMEALAMLPLMFSDERMKDNIEQVGELYDGQPVYRYNMKGSPKTQIGLMAQDLERSGHSDAVAGLGGLKMVDYKRATDVAAGLAPRRGFQDGGVAEEDIPIVLAALQNGPVEPNRQTGVVPPVVMSDAEPPPSAAREETRGAGIVRPLGEPRTVGLAPGMPQGATGVAPTRDASTETGAPPRLLSRESGMSFSAVNPDTGAAGRAQFMATRLQDAKRAGVIPQDMTMTQFLNDRDAQVRTERWHFSDVNRFIDSNNLDQYVGTSVNGVPVTRDGMVAVAHLGGSAGLKRFLETGGRYNPADANGTRLSDYLAMGAGNRAPGVAGEQRPDRAERATPASAGLDAGESPFATLFGGAFGGMEPRTQQALMSENFWIPALAGLGSMLSSKSPYLLGAIGEGLSGGAGAYTTLQKQTSDILKQRFDIARNVFRGPIMNQSGEFVWEDTRTGEMLTQPEYQRRYNAFLTGRTGAVEPRPGAAAIEVAREVKPTPVASAVPASPPAAGAPTPPAPMPREEPVPSMAAPAEARETPSAPAPAPAAAAAPVAEGQPNVAQMRQRALENADLWRNTDPAMNPRVLLPQVNSLDAQIKDLEKRADEASRLATRAGERSPQQGTIYQNQATNLLGQAGRLREEMREKLARANQSLDAAVQLQVEEAKQRQIGNVQREFKEEIGPDGTKVSLPPGVQLPRPTPPQPTPEQLSAPKKAEVDPRTGNLMTARPAAPAGGGLILPDVPPGAKVTELSPVAKNQLEVDKQFLSDFAEKAPSIGQARQRYMALINAFKLFESGSTAATRAGWAAIAETFGYPDIARSIINGDPSSVQWVEKTGPSLVLDALKAATPRFAQSEFTTLLGSGTPEPNKLPQVNFQMVKESLALLNRSEAFIYAWDRASREDGWRSPSAYYSAWSQANPLSKFEEAAELKMGNFKGMPLPPSDKWVPGTIYTVPSNLSTAQMSALSRFGLKPGEPFQYLGRDVPPDQRIRRIDPRQLYSIPAMGQ